MRKFYLPLLLFLSPLASYASVLVSWNFTANLAPTINATASVASASNATLAAISGGWQNNATGTNVGPSAGNGTWSPSSLGTVQTYDLGDSNVVNGGAGFLQTSGWGTTMNASRYVSFNLTMNSSIEPAFAQLEGIRFNLASAGTSAPRGVEVTYRIGTSGNFTSLGGTAVPVNAANQYGLFTFNLPTSATLSPGDVIEFRLLGYAPDSGAGLRFDNVRITAIPEPAVLSVAGLAIGSFALLRRRRKGLPAFL